MIVAEGITYVVQDRALLRDLSFRIAPGERVVFTGPSGSGKSTLLKLLQGFLAPQTGTIFIQGRELTPSSAPSLRHLMAWLPQSSLPETTSVREALAHPFRFRHNRSLTPEEREIHERLEMLRLSPAILEQSLLQVSGGEKQRLGILLCFLLRRPLLLLDEPTSSLDEASKEAVVRFVMENPSLTVLSTSHDPFWVGKNDREVVIA